VEEGGCRSGSRTSFAIPVLGFPFPREEDLNLQHEWKAISARVSHKGIETKAWEDRFNLESCLILDGHGEDVVLSVQSVEGS
jgi:hypothetical protein